MDKKGLQVNWFWRIGWLFNGLIIGMVIGQFL